MHRSLRTHVLGALLATALLPSAASAQSQQLSLGLGYFSVRGEDARVENDVLVTDIFPRGRGYYV